MLTVVVLPLVPVTPTSCNCRAGQPYAAAAASGKSFAAPEEAVDAVVKACEKDKTKTLLDIFGPEGKDIVESGDRSDDHDREPDFLRKILAYEQITATAIRALREHFGLISHASGLMWLSALSEPCSLAPRDALNAGRLKRQACFPG